MKTINHLKLLPFLLGLGFFLWSCGEEKEAEQIVPEYSNQLTIFFVNDQHGQLENFAKVKYIVDGAKDSLNVLLVCAGDMFSGNPIVDQYNQKGYPMIDIMNKTGFDVSVLGNHEFDYGQTNLASRMQQAEFQWVCANLNTGNTDLQQPDPYTSITVNDLTVTFLGLVETNGKPDDIIPSTHPWKVLGLEFQRYWDVVEDYTDLKQSESSDLLVALTHLGATADRNLANTAPYFDLIIGGHSHEVIDEEVNGIPIVQSGSYLNNLGRIDLKFLDEEVVDYSVSFISLNNYSFKDQQLSELIETYNNAPEFDEVIGSATSYLSRDELGCFYTTALMEYLDTDCSFQNGGGIRSDLDAGDITTLEIYNMDPFNNQSVVFTMTISEIKQFFQETGAGLHVSGITLEQQGNSLYIYDKNGVLLDDNAIISIGINDYIPAVFDSYFPIEKADIKDFTTAEAIIAYLKSINDQIDYAGCDQFFDYQ